MNILFISISDDEQNFENQLINTFAKNKNFKTMRFNCLDSFFAQKVLKPIYNGFGRYFNKTSASIVEKQYKKNKAPFIISKLASVAQKNIEEFLVTNDCDIIVCSHIIPALALEEIVNARVFLKTTIYMTPNYFVPPFLTNLTNLNYISLCTKELFELAQPNILKNLTIISPPLIKVKEDLQKSTCKKQLRLNASPTVLISLGNRFSNYTKKLVKNLCFSDEEFNIIVHTSNEKVKTFLEDNNFITNNKKIILSSSEKTFVQSIVASDLLICDLKPYNINNAIKNKLPIIIPKYLSWENKRVFNYLKDHISIAKIDKNHLAFRQVERFLTNVDRQVLIKESLADYKFYDGLDDFFTKLFVKEKPKPQLESATQTKSNTAKTNAKKEKSVNHTEDKKPKKSDKKVKKVNNIKKPNSKA